MDQKQFIYGFTSQVVTVGQGLTAAAFVSPVAMENLVTFQVPRNDFFLVPVPASATLTTAQLLASATFGLALATLPLYQFNGSPRFALATTGNTAIISILKGLSAPGGGSFFVGT